MNRYDNRLRILTEEYETLISRENKRIRSNNGIFERYKYPILTAAHTPLEWRYDFNPETNPFLMERFGINAVFNAGAIKYNGKYLIMANGIQAYAVRADAPEKDNPLRTAEMTLEDDYGMIDGVINNGRRGEELEKAQEYAERTTPEKPSIRERLEDAKRECAEHKPPEGKKPGRDVPEHDCL